jgi:phage FluMu gp28-like protein
VTRFLKTLRALFLVQCLNLARATGLDDARWEHFQLSHLNDNSTFRIEDKSRQIAWSWLAAAEAVASAIVDDEDTIFVSINLEEAKEKVRYARRIYDCLEMGGLPRLATDNQLGLEFATPNRARITSLPSKPPRGRARANVVLDEFAHVQHDKKIYTAALPVISKGGRLRIGSSPFGATGVFYEVYSEALQAYPGYTRKRTPWWEVFSFCKNVPEARKLAPALDTDARIEMFGTDRIKAIYANMVLEDFQQEYEAEFVDESSAWITLSEIKAAQDPELLCAFGLMRGENSGKVFEAIEKVARWVEEKKIERVLDAGVDIGRTRNTTEIYLVGESTTRSFPLRLCLTLDNVEYDDQLGVLSHVLKSLPVARMLVDQNGIGNNLAENLRKMFPAKAQGVTFSLETKKLWATDAKMLVQQHKTPLPQDRDLAYQIHSIKRVVTASKNLVFDTDRNEKHHADKFWAWALSLAAALSKPVRRQTTSSVIYQDY